MRQCNVLINRKLAGVLTEEDKPKQYIFQYNADYVKTCSEPVCLSMPLRKEPYRSTNLFPYFANLLSEGANRIIQARLLNIDKEDDFGILLATAQYDTVGVVTVSPFTQDDNN